MTTKHFKPVYPIDPWNIREEKFCSSLVPQSESIFSVGNGYLGLRGNQEEGAPAYQSGTYINGFYEYRPLVYGETAFGYPKDSQTMINITDGKIIKLKVDGETFHPETAKLKEYKRTLNMSHGILRREILWVTSQGKEVLIKTMRLASFHRKHLAAITYEVTILSGDADIVIDSELVSNESNQLNEWDPREVAPIYGQVLLGIDNACEGQALLSSHKTKNSALTLVCRAEHDVETHCHYTHKGHSEECLGRITYHAQAKKDEPFKVIKFLAYHSSDSEEKEQLEAAAERTCSEAMSEGIDAIIDEQIGYMDHFWNQCDIEIEGDDTLQQGMRFSLFHIIQSVGKSGTSGMAAKGLTGQGYEGHYFWDTEIYVLPFFTYTMPHIARNLLQFRHSMLDKARKRADELSEKGALFPWRTINGEEASAFFPAGTAQFHINADIMYALKKYVDVTGDDAVLTEFGAEMLIETARFWYSFGHFSEQRGGAFCIHGVTGPDEYTALVNNNVYTNMMARENLLFAHRVLSESPDVYHALMEKTHLTDAEISAWKQAADKMYIPYNEELKIYPQDEAFLDKERWHFDEVPEENYPLLLHYHPLKIYRYQVIKQSDLLLAMFLLSKYFTKEEIKRNFDYYDPLTTGDSSLSDCVQGIIAVSIGYHSQIYDYFMETVEMDLENVNKNVRDGVHIASMAGAWLYVVYGFAGMRDNDGNLSFNPRIPKHWKKVRFSLKIRDCMLTIAMTPESTTYSLAEGKKLDIVHRDEAVTIVGGADITKENEPLDLTS